MRDELARAYASLIARDPNTGMSLLQYKLAKEKAQEMVKKLGALGFDLSRPSGIILKSMLLVGYSPREALQAYASVESTAIEWYKAKEMTERWKQQLALQQQEIQQKYALERDRLRMNYALGKAQIQNRYALGRAQLQTRYALGKADLQERIRHNQIMEQLQAQDVASRIWERHKRMEMLGKQTQGAGSGIDLKGLKANTQTLSELTQTYFDQPLNTLNKDLEKWQSVLTKGIGEVDPDTLRQAKIKYEALSSVRDLYIHTRQKTLECIQQSGQPSALVFDECRRRVNEQLLKDLHNRNSTILAMYYSSKLPNLKLEEETEQKLYAQEFVRNLATYDQNLAGAMALAIKNSAQGRLIPEAIPEHRRIPSPKPEPEPKPRPSIGFKDTMKEMWQDYKENTGAGNRLYTPVNGAMVVELPEGIYQVKKTKDAYTVYNTFGKVIGSAKTMKQAFDVGNKYLGGK